MKQKLFISLGILIVFVLAISFVVSGQQTNQTDTSPFSNLTFVVTPTRDTFLLVEPIVLNLRLINNTTSPILGHTNIDFDSAHVDLYVSNQQGDKMLMGGLRTEIKNREAFQDKPIPPNYRVEVTDVFYTLHRYFPEIGTYTFEFVFRGTKPGQEIKAAPFTISIVEPTGRDRAAYNFLKTKNVKPYFFYGQGSADPDTFKHFENIANQFGDTDYGDYATWVVANTYHFRRDKVKAKQMLKRLQSRPNFVFKEKVKKLLEELEEEESQP